MIADLLRAAGPRGRARAVRPDPELAAADVEPVPSIPATPWGFLRRNVVLQAPRRLLLLVVLAAVAQVFASGEAWVLKRIVDALAAGEAGAVQETASVAGFWFAVLVAVWFLDTGAWRLAQVVDIYTSPTLRAVAQKHLFGYLLGHSPRYFQDNFAGKLGQKIKQAGQACASIVDIVCFDGVKMVVALAVGLVLLSGVDGRLAAVLAAWSVLYGALSWLLARRCIALSHSLSSSQSTLTGRMVDAIANADLIRGFARGADERLHLGAYVDAERAASRRLRWFLVWMRVFQMVAVLGLLAVLVWVALRATVAGTMTVGGFTLVFALSSGIAMAVWNLSNRLLDFFEHLGTLSEALELVSQPHEIVDPPGAPVLRVTAGAVRFDRVTFAHPDGQPLFRDFSLDIRPGEKVALVGHSGAGKSTLVKLLRRQYAPQGGRVLIDGQDVALAAWDSVNAAIAEVPQQPGVFHRPIRENIRYGRPDATEEDVVRAAVDAHCHEFIVARPSGYDTIVGEQGIKLSGGERQRVAIARALLKDARILVLDEATSALDSESEHLIQDALWRLFEGRTVIAIAHRLSTITGMDRIVVLDRGRIVEEGGHAELVARGGVYAGLWARQAGGFLEAA